MEVVQVARTKPQKRIDIGTRVSGCFGELFDAGTGHKRRHRQRLNGTVISSVGTKQFQVKFDDDKIRVVYSNQLRVESAIDSLPPDLRPATQAPAQEPQNDTDSEHLPGGGTSQMIIVKTERENRMRRERLQVGLHRKLGIIQLDHFHLRVMPKATNIAKHRRFKKFEVNWEPS
jgi:hypothetical protein